MALDQRVVPRDGWKLLDVENSYASLYVGRPGWLVFGGFP